MKLQEFLRARHLDGLSLPDWEQRHERLYYPVYRFDGSRIEDLLRFRSLDPQAEQRFGWSKAGNTPRMFWYHDAQARRHAIDSSGVLYLTSGETDCLTLVAAGIHNVVAFFGESTAFTLAELRGNGTARGLVDLGVRHIIHILDNDAAGARASVHQYATISEAGLQYTALAPSERFKDLNEAWVHHRNAPALLEDLHPTRFHLTADPTPARGGYDFPKLNREITTLLKQHHGLGDGRRARCRCPIHHGDHLNAVWNEDTGTLTCFSQCGQTYHTLDLIRLANWGIDVDSPTYRLPLANADSKHPTLPDVAPPTPIVPSWNYISQAEAAYAHLASMDPGGNPRQFIINPFKSLHALKGNIYLLARRKMTAIIAPTGGGKTTFIESLARKLLAQGEDVAFFGYEWSPEEYINRELVRQLDVPLEDIIRHQVWVYEEWARNHQTVTSNHGTPLSPQQLEKYVRVIADLTSPNRAQIYYFDKPELPPEQTEAQLNQLLETDTLRNTRGDLRAYIVQTITLVKSLRARGRKISVLFYDYLQLLTTAGRDPFQSVQDTTAILKTLALVLDVHIIVTSQAKKSAIENVRGDNLTTVDDHGVVNKLDMTAGEYMSPHAFNAVLGVVGAYRDGEFLGYVAIQALKNNTGIANGMPVYLYANFQRLTIYDKIYPLKTDA